VSGEGEPGTPAELLEATFTPHPTAATSHTSGVGTQAYAAPEQLTSSKVSLLSAVLHSTYSVLGLANSA
jgi:hypothetical protein